MPLNSSKTIFEEAGVEDISCDTRSRILRTMEKVVKAKARLPLSKKHMSNRVPWAKKYLKLDFSKVLFTDECRATLDGLDGWSRGWLVEGQRAPLKYHHQQRGRGVMFWAAIIGDTLVGPFWVPEGVKLTSQAYTQFLDQNFFPWYTSQTRSFKQKCIFMHDNAPSHAAKFTKDYLSEKSFSGDRLMEWPPCSPNLNCIENLWNIVKSKIYCGGKQCASKEELWNAILNSCKGINPSVISNLTALMDDRLVKVLEE